MENLIGLLPDHAMMELKQAGITDKKRLAHFLAQCSHESANFTVVYENLNYSAKGLLSIFPKYFTPEQAAAYERKPQMIANKVYANRMGNGNEMSGDGYAYRGRGYIQLTGKDNYKQFTDYIKSDCVTDPNKVALVYPLTSALFFFTKNNIWSICDQGATPDIVRKVTLKVNGGTHGLEDRQKKFDTYLRML